MKDLLTLSLILLFALGMASPLWSGAVRGDSADTCNTLYVLAIGISDYESSPLLKLSYARRDAEGVARVFSDPATLPCLDHRVFTLYDKAASPEEIQAAMASVAASATPEDILIFYFSGHGGRG